MRIPASKSSVKQIPLDKISYSLDLINVKSQFKIVEKLGCTLVVDSGANIFIFDGGEWKRFVVDDTEFSFVDKITNRVYLVNLKNKSVLLQNGITELPLKSNSECKSNLGDVSLNSNMQPNENGVARVPSARSQSFSSPDPLKSQSLHSQSNLSRRISSKLTESSDSTDSLNDGTTENSDSDKTESFSETDTKPSIEGTYLGPMSGDDFDDMPVLIADIGTGTVAPTMPAVREVNRLLDELGSDSEI